jgi:putative transposase
VQITDRLGRNTRTQYTADYLVVYKTKVCAVEIKADSDLAELLANRPEDWKYENGRYRYVPAQKYFGAMGIEHSVTPISAFNTIRADNLNILSSVRRAPETRRYRKFRNGLMHLLRDEETMLMADILERIGDTDTTPILQLIDSGLVFADLDNATLSDPSSVWVSIDPNLVGIAHEASENLANVLNGNALGASDIIDPMYELEVATRLLVAEGLSKTNRHGKVVSSRTIRRHRSALKKGQGNPVSLQPKWANCGNRDLRICLMHQTYLEECIHQYKKDSTHPSIYQCFRTYVKAFDEARLTLDFFDDRPICRASFYNIWHRTPHRNEDSYCKGGRRLENAEADAIDPSHRSIVASRPFAVAHIDHWKCDFFLVVGIVNGKVITARPWLTAMVDAFSGEVLAIWLSFANPSRKSCTMVIRDCVRRHGKLPEMIVVDGGSDFRSCHFQVMLATLGIVRCERPPEDPRFGNEVERVFGAFKERFARGLPGYGISIEKARAISSSCRSHKRATLSLLDAFNTLESYVFNGYNHSPKPGESSSRVALKERALRYYPHCGRATSWDLKFLIATSIEAPASGYKLWPGRGLHVDEKWYTSSKLAAYRGYKKELTVRLEPYADSVIYVCIEGKWLICMTSRAKFQFAMSERSLLMASAERSDLSAVRKELENEMTRYAASIVNQRLDEISKRGESKPADSENQEPASGESTYPGNRTLFNFDDIEPYANESL